MTLLTVYTFPDSILKQIAKPIEVFDRDLENLADNMLNTMYACNGIGLAANQVGILKRIVVVDVFSGNEDQSTLEPQVFVNPEIIEESGEVVTEEGCLSVTDFRAEIKRAEQINLKYQDVHGNLHQVATEGIKAICIQHELDHLNGILFIDHLPMLKQNMVKKKLIKQAQKTV